MKCNVREIAQLSDKPCIMEGRLNYKKVANGSYRNQAVFKERWFRLINNYLFYFKISDMGKFDTKQPAGMMVLENSSIQMEHGPSISFSFSISFIDEPEKRHIFAARSEDNVVQWVLKLRQCSYEYLRNQLHTLQSKIFSITGKDPLLMVPRNDGACLWAPSVPFSTAPACTKNTTSFSCHLHTNGAFTLERSKSDVQAHMHLRTDYCSSTKFYVSEVSKKETTETSQSYSLEKSKTSAQHLGSLNPLDISIFDNRPMYSRAAPSPPVRTKLSPNTRRTEINREIKTFTDISKNLGQMSILDVTPVPPRRKISPKPVNEAGKDKDDKNPNNDMLLDSSEDLIKL
ncbi:uncharacterized protein LOC116779139 [Danaus plexippus]|uniref:Pleckstrin homology domain-containing family J member 1 n=1 Tax=Danaus plexippus plexippus TaxID=278856 RepID=A0A212FJV6_DANPL|nr:uncharacterized protein LOC116779139 [Danaus plexippus]OWR54012.1 Pleckstrin proteiny domain-containing family J member 1 [Danaus plexippus plexippus]